MRVRFDRRNAGIALVTLLLAAAALAPPAAAAPQTGPGWYPWLGCWRLEDDRTNDRESVVDGDNLVCLTPGRDPAGAKHTSFVDGELVLEQELVVDADSRAVQQSGCTGWERGSWSADGDRLYIDSELTCEGGTQRTVTGASMLIASDTWLDVSVANVDDQRELVVRRYRAVSPIPLALDSAGVLGAQRVAVANARLAASGPLDADDVIEAVRLVDPAVVEAILVESRASFAIDSRLLIALDDAQVPPSIIDLMVALSFPDYFVVNEEPQPEARRPVPVYAAGYSSAWFAPFGYGYYYPGYGYPGTVIVVGPRYGGRVVSGRGYTRVSTRPDAPGGGLGRLWSGKGGGSVSPEGASSGSGSGGQSSDRKAKPRGGS